MHWWSCRHFPIFTSMSRISQGQRVSYRLRLTLESVEPYDVYMTAPINVKVVRRALDQLVVRSIVEISRKSLTRNRYVSAHPRSKKR